MMVAVSVETLTESIVDSAQGALFVWGIISEMPALCSHITESTQDSSKLLCYCRAVHAPVTVKYYRSKKEDLGPISCSFGSHLCLLLACVHLSEAFS